MKSFLMNTEKFSEMPDQLKTQLNQFKVEKKDILLARLLVEEIFWRMVKRGKIEQFKIKVVKNFFGSVLIKMTSEDVPYNPLVEVEDFKEDEDEDDENYFNLMVINAYRQRLNYSRKNNLNIVTINIRRKSDSPAFLTIAAIFGGLICGILMKEILMPETILLVKEIFIMPTQTMFLNALNLLITPVIFFSIVNGVTGISKGTGIGRIGLKLISYSLCLMIVSVCFSHVVAWIFFEGGVPQINALPAAAEISADAKQFSFIKFIVDIIPGDFVSPVAEGKVLQILFIAVFFGIALNSLGDKISNFKELLGNLNDIFMKMISLLMFFMPLVVFFLMMNLAFDTAAETLMLISKLLFGELIVIALLLVFCAIFIRYVGKISSTPFFRKDSEVLPTTFATSSSITVMPSMMKLCTNKLGIAPKISSFSIPLSVTFNTAGSLICIVMASVMFLRMYSIEIDVHAFVIISFLAIMFSFGAPDFISVTIIAGNFGVPAEIAALMFCIDALSDRLGTCVNVFSNMSATLTLARTENLLDEKIYFSS